jgi:dipeptidyl aminopeptidase/acylaminoacyl peptidase
MKTRFVLSAVVLIATTASAQEPPTGGRGGGRANGRTDTSLAARSTLPTPRAPAQWRGPMDSVRARQLYVSGEFKDLAGCGNGDCGRADKARDDSIFAARAPGKYKYEKTSYRSAVDGLEIPVYVFSPLRGTKHPALVWIHGGVHGDWGPNPYLPFIVEAVERGYVIIAPDYRGSTGYSEEFYRKIDYGGWEVDDVYSSYDFIKTRPEIDSTKVGLMGWSHGGFIASHIVFRGKTPFKSAAAIVPVTNLFMRLMDHGPGYARSFAAEERVGGMPFDVTCGPKRDEPCVDEYLRRSPVFHVANLQVPILVHVATNDCDVFFRENQQMVHTLRSLKPNLAETKIYVNPPWGGGGCGHTFSRRANADLTARDDTPEQIDSWNRTWAFFERTLGVKPPARKR